MGQIMASRDQDTLQDEDAADPGLPIKPLPALPEPSGSGAVIPYDPLQRYMSEVKRFSMLSAEEEHDLAIRYREHGDSEAAYRLVSSHLRLVVRMAMDFKRSWMNILDLIQEGNVGLVLAVKKFDPHKGSRLSTYATWWIRAYLIKFLIDNWSMVRVGTTNARRKLLFNLTEEKEKLERRGIQASPKLLAEHFGVKEQDVVDVQSSLGAHDTSIDTPLSDDGVPLTERLAASVEGADEELIQKEYQEIISSKLKEFAVGVGDRERYILEKRLLADEPETLQALGDRFGMSREGVRQVEKRLMRDLKAFMSEALRDYGELFFEVEPPAHGSRQKDR